MTYGGTVPAITPGYAGFVNGDSASVADARRRPVRPRPPARDPASPPTYPSSCSGAADPNYTIGYVGGSVTIDKAPLTVTASSPAMTYGGTVPAITPGYAGFVNGDSASSLSAKPTCSTTATSSSPGIAARLHLLVLGRRRCQLHRSATGPDRSRSTRPR